MLNIKKLVLLTSLISFSGVTSRCIVPLHQSLSSNQKSSEVITPNNQTVLLSTTYNQNGNNGFVFPFAGVNGIEIGKNAGGTISYFVVNLSAYVLRETIGDFMYYGNGCYDAKYFEPLYYLISTSINHLSPDIRNNYFQPGPGAKNLWSAAYNLLMTSLKSYLESKFQTWLWHEVMNKAIGAYNDDAGLELAFSVNPVSGWVNGIWFIQETKVKVKDPADVKANGITLLRGDLNEPNNELVCSFNGPYCQLFAGAFKTGAEFWPWFSAENGLQPPDSCPYGSQIKPSAEYGRHANEGDMNVPIWKTTGYVLMKQTIISRYKEIQQAALDNQFKRGISLVFTRIGESTLNMTIRPQGYLNPPANENLNDFSYRTNLPHAAWELNFSVDQLILMRRYYEQGWASGAASLYNFTTALTPWWHWTQSNQYVYALMKKSSFELPFWQAYVEEKQGSPFHHIDFMNQTFHAIVQKNGMYIRWNKLRTGLGWYSSYGLQSKDFCKI